MKKTEKKYFRLDDYLNSLMNRMGLEKTNFENQKKLRAAMEKQLLNRLMTALSLNLDEAALKTFEQEAKREGNEMVNVVNTILSTNETAYDAVMKELNNFEKEILEIFKNFK